MNPIATKAAALLALCLFALTAPGSGDAEPLPATQEEICPLLINSKAPTAERLTAQEQSFDLSGLIGKKPTILVFYRGDW